MQTPISNSAVGRFGEDVAVAHLQGLGLQVLARNWRCDIGEIDVVALDGDELVVCEVKTRSGTGFGGPLEAVSTEKAVRLRLLGIRYARDAVPAVRHGGIRVDVIGVLRRGGSVELEHVRNAC